MADSILCEWDGEAFRPLPRHAKSCNARFVVGERYMVEPEAPHNMLERRAYFAQIREGWLNLPESIAAEFPTPDHLRKHALVKTGYADEKTIVCRTNRDAVMAAAFIEALDGFAIIEVRGNVLKAWKPQSQSVKAMGSDAFRASKNAVLDWIAKAIAVAPETLALEAGQR
jgi:hypothetical protein